MTVAAIAWLIVTVALCVLPLVVALRRLRPRVEDTYCCLCQDQPCGWGCCHRSCVDHEIVRHRHGAG